MTQKTDMVRLFAKEPGSEGLYDLVVPLNLWLSQVPTLLTNLMIKSSDGSELATRNSSSTSQHYAKKHSRVK